MPVASVRRGIGLQKVKIQRNPWWVAEKITNLWVDVSRKMVIEVVCLRMA